MSAWGRGRAGTVSIWGIHGGYGGAITLELIFLSCLTFKRELYYTAYSYSRVGKLVVVGTFCVCYIAAVNYYLKVECVAKVLDEV